MRREMKKEDGGVAWRREMARETGLGWEDGGRREPGRGCGGEAAGVAVSGHCKVIKSEQRGRGRLV